MMNPHLKNFIKGFIKLILILSLLVGIVYWLNQNQLISFDRLISSFLIGIIVLTFGMAVLWLLFKMTSEIYKSILGRCHRIEEMKIVNNQLHIIAYYVRSGGDDGPDSGYYYYILNMENKQLNIQKNSENSTVLDFKPDFKTKNKRNKKMDAEEFSIQTDQYLIQAFPFKSLFGFDSGYKIICSNDSKMLWAKKL